MQLNTSFSQKLPNLQLAWDSVSRGAMKTCPRYYKYTIIDGYAGTEENVHFVFGIGFHTALELYDRKIASGLTHHQALIDTVRYILSYTWNFGRQRPWLSLEPTKTRLTLIRSVIWYLDQFKDDALKTYIQSDGTPAVELSFHYECGINSITHEPYLLCGHLDRVVEWNDHLWIVDSKTTKQTLGKDTEKFFEKFEPDDQMSGYYFGGTIIFDRKIKGIIINAAQTAVNFTKFQRGETTRSPEKLNEWIEDTELLFREAEMYAQKNRWPKREKSCNNYGGCTFRLVCSSEPKQRQKLLDNFYTKRIWDPMITREI